MNKNVIKTIIKNECLYGNINIIKNEKELNNSILRILNENIKFDYTIIFNTINNLDILISNTISKIIIIIDTEKSNYKKLFKKIKINKLYLVENYYVAIGGNKNEKEN